MDNSAHQDNDAFYDPQVQRELRLVWLLELAEELAEKQADGHLTIMRFTTGWKIMLGTPHMEIHLDKNFEIIGDGYGAVKKLKSFKALEQALSSLLNPDCPCCNKDGE